MRAPSVYLDRQVPRNDNMFELPGDVQIISIISKKSAQDLRLSAGFTVKRSYVLCLDGLKSAANRMPVRLITAQSRKAI